MSFGGLHVIAFGDFHQCTPVGDSPLWKAHEGNRNPAKEAGRKLWVDFFTLVVDLQEIMRQRDELQWAEFLRRMRSNTCTLEDDAFISAIAARSADLSAAHWRSAVVLTPVNDVQKAICGRCAKRDAFLAHVRLVQWVAHYKKDRTWIQPSQIQMAAHGQGCGPHLFEYAPKMPVMLLSNRVCGSNSVAFGLANGTTGFLVGLVLDPRERQPHDDNNNEDVHALHFVPKGAFVYVPGLQVTPWPHLPQNVIDMADGHAESIVYIKAALTKLEGKGCSGVSRYQLPLLPAYALTIHKAQGLSIPACIIDAGTKLFSYAHHLAYVALSRVTSSQGLAFFYSNGFSTDWIHHAPHQQLLDEEQRLNLRAITQ